MPDREVIWPDGTYIRTVVLDQHVGLNVRAVTEEGTSEVHLALLPDEAAGVARMLTGAAREVIQHG